MEYLTTYGWAVLVIGIVVFGLYESNAFGGSSALPTACVAQTGFLCSSPKMNTTGNVIVTFGEALGVPISITGLGCSNTSTEPSFASNSMTLQPGEETTLTFQCPLSSNAVGASFTGTLWIQYTKNGQTGQVGQIATLTAKTITSNQIVVSTSTTTTSTTTVATTTILYDYNGVLGSGSTTLNSGDSIYFCNEGYDTYSGSIPSAVSWTTDANTINRYWANAGHQTSNVCSETDSNPAGTSLAGIGIESTNQYSIINTPLAGSGSPFSTSYNVPQTGSGSFVVISAACGPYGSCSAVSVPSGCTPVVTENVGTGALGTSYIAVCSDVSSGSYTVTLTESSGSSEAVAVYDFGMIASVSVSPNAIVQGESTTITSNTVGGLSPYTYQWYEEAPGASSFSAISGATSSSYAFSTTVSQTTGTYEFEVQVSDSESPAQTTTSSPVSVIVNAQGSTITYVGSGNEKSASLTVQSGFDIYFCNEGYDTYSGSIPSAVSWTTDANTINRYWANAGHQTSNVCSETDSNPAGTSLAGIGLWTTNSYTIINTPLAGSGSPFSTSYTVAQSGSFVVISAACGPYGSCSAVSVPSGCTPVVTENVGTGALGTSYIAVCSDVSSGSYTVTLTESSGSSEAVAVYDFGVP